MRGRRGGRANGVKSGAVAIFTSISLHSIPYMCLYLLRFLSASEYFAGGEISGTTVPDDPNSNISLRSLSERILDDPLRDFRFAFESISPTLRTFTIPPLSLVLFLSINLSSSLSSFNTIDYHKSIFFLLAFYHCSIPIFFISLFL